MRVVCTALLISSFVTSAFAQPVELDLPRLQAADVAFLGEIHDNPQHHITQAEIVTAMAPKAVVFEMLSPQQAAQITPHLLGDAAALEAALNWQDSGWPVFSMYYPVFKAATGAAFYGALVARDDLREAMMGGDVAKLFGDEAALYGLTAPLPTAQQAQREQKQFVAHCEAMPRDILPAMVLGQRMRDARLAQTVEQALADTGGPVVVITGNGHARTDWGAPTLLISEVSSLSLGQFEAPHDGDAPFDFTVVVAPVERDDPCDAFR